MPGSCAARRTDWIVITDHLCQYRVSSIEYRIHLSDDVERLTSVADHSITFLFTITMTISLLFHPSSQLTSTRLHEVIAVDTLALL